MPTISQTAFQVYFDERKVLYFDSLGSSVSNWQFGGISSGHKPLITWTNADSVHRRIYAALG